MSTRKTYLLITIINIIMVVVCIIILEKWSNKNITITNPFVIWFMIVVMLATTIGFIVYLFKYIDET
jgi:uncharacterized membrane protein